MSYLERIDRALHGIDGENRRRHVRDHDPEAIDFSSNDYLGLARHPAVVHALHGARRAGSGGSRLLAGAYAEHRALETALADYVEREAALLFSSGYLAAAGALPALGKLFAHAYSDELNHACLIDGLRLSKMHVHVYPHGRLPARSEREQPALVVSETIFGMDGDAVDVQALQASLGPGDALVLDEAHALGVAGPRGRGLAAGLGDERTIVLGTLSKALGSLGGFIAGPAQTIAYLTNVARTFIYDTSLPPALAAASAAALELARCDDRPRLALAQRRAELADGLRALGLPVPAGDAASLTVVLGDSARALDVSRELRARGLSVPAIRPPTVPPGTSRLRITLRADHRPSDIAALLGALAATLPHAATLQ